VEIRKKEMTMLMLLCVALVIAVGLSLSGFAAPPNVVIVLADDQGWGDLSVHGNTNLSTPRIDSLAHDGALFSRFYAQPVCAPTRAEMLTGRYHPRTGVRGVSRGQERMNVDESTLADMLQQAGYATGAFGKWHNGSQHPYHPNSRGFDEYYGFTSGHWGNYFDPMLEHNGEIVRGNGFIIDDLTAHAMDFIEANKEKPFLCYLAYNTLHSPFQVPEKFYKTFAHADLGMRHRDGDAKEELDKTRAALAMCENIDWNVGRVLDQLENLNLADNTIVIYYSDNGPNTYRWNNDMRGRKGMTDEGGVRVPCMVRWPAGGIQPGTRIDSIAGAIDLLPTLAEMTGAKRVGDKPIDGLSLAPMLRGENVSWPDHYIYSIRQSKKVSVRNQRYILDDQGQLYDLNTDPGQRTAINEQEPAVAAELARAVQQCQDEIGKRKRCVVVAGIGYSWGYGHGSAPTYFYARDVV
jgi:arylsulfatase A-like enzyme